MWQVVAKFPNNYFIDWDKLCDLAYHIPLQQIPCQVCKYIEYLTWYLLLLVEVQISIRLDDLLWVYIRSFTTIESFEKTQSNFSEIWDILMLNTICQVVILIIIQLFSCLHVNPETDNQMKIWKVCTIKFVTQKSSLKVPCRVYLDPQCN